MAPKCSKPNFSHGCSGICSGIAPQTSSRCFSRRATYLQWSVVTTVSSYCDRRSEIALNGTQVLKTELFTWLFRNLQWHSATNELQVLLASGHLPAVVCSHYGSYLLRQAVRDGSGTLEWLISGQNRTF